MATFISWKSICKVSGALYGLSWPPKTFHDHIDDWFRQNGFVRSTGDSCLYLKRPSAIQESDIGKHIRIQDKQVWIDNVERKVTWGNVQATNVNAKIVSVDNKINGKVLLQSDDGTSSS